MSAGTVVVQDSLGDAGMRYTNAGQLSFAYQPATVTIQISRAAVQAAYPICTAALIEPPTGWQVVGAALQSLPAAQDTVSWVLVPGGVPGACRHDVRVLVQAAGATLATLTHPITVELHGQSVFDPVHDIPPFRNSAADLGEVEPQRALFNRTYRHWGVVFPDAFFQGLYRDIVFLAATPDARGGGGLCTGMARFALSCSLTGVHPAAAQIRDTVAIWHGRQLTDAALLAAARQFLTPNTAASFQHFRDQVLRSGQGAVAFDVGIARWTWSPQDWPATLHRLVTQGHTIVPYAFVQTDDQTAQVQVYDPSHPGEDEAAANVVHFDLANNRYQYRGFGALAHDDPTTVLAVDQRPFSEPGTAYLASLASTAIYPAASWRELRISLTSPRGLLAIAGLLGLGAVRLLRGRRRAH